MIEFHRKDLLAYDESFDLTEQQIEFIKNWRPKRTLPEASDSSKTTTEETNDKKD